MTAFASAMQRGIRGDAAGFHAASARRNILTPPVWAYFVEKVGLI
tara:strand:+ start:2458 stop:2592 length:135 start_codon:yes stop_codon:yes gene_type:complete